MIKLSIIHLGAAVLCALITLGGCKGSAGGAGAGRVGATLLAREHEFYRESEDGLKGAAGKAGYELVVTSGDLVLNGGGVRDRALKAAENMPQAHPDIKAVFGINDDDSALGALSAAEALDRKALVIVGYDATPEAVNAIRRGSQLKADVAQQPRDIGARTIEVISTHFGGGQVPPTIAVHVRLVDAESLKAGGGISSSAPPGSYRRATCSARRAVVEDWRHLSGAVPNDAQMLARGAASLPAVATSQLNIHGRPVRGVRG